MTPAQRLTAAIQSPKRPGRPAIMPYLTSGWPDRDGFGDLLTRVAQVADVVEVGVPFSDPMADGPVIQRTSREAIDQGVNLPWILETIGALPEPPAAPMVLMSYLNPILAYGLERLVVDAKAVGVCGFILPDLPWEESVEARALMAEHGMASIQLVTPVTPADRLAQLTGGEGGFVYAVTVTGITGSAMEPAEVTAYLDRVRAVADKPVCAGFGIRSADQVEALAGHADGVVVGSALLQALGEGKDPVAWLTALAGA